MVSIKRGFAVSSCGGLWEEAYLNFRHLSVRRKLNEALAGPVEALLDGAGDDAWPAPNKKIAGSAWD
ncbi:hypothetical protein P3S68_013796 [Capsicum galapagoense]